MRVGIGLLRGVVGSLLVGHGLQKLSSRFGWPGLDAAAESFAAVGLKPGRPYAQVTGVSQVLSGGMFALGFMTPLAASVITANMVNAARYVHGRNGIWLSQDGSEYLIVLSAAVFAVTAAGPGALSLDDRLGIGVSGTGAALGQFALGVAGADLAVRAIAARVPAGD